MRYSRELKIMAKKALGTIEIPQSRASLIQAIKTQIVYGGSLPLYLMTVTQSGGHIS